MCGRSGGITCPGGPVHYLHELPDDWEPCKPCADRAALHDLADTDLEGTENYISWLCLICRSEFMAPENRKDLEGYKNCKCPK